MPGSNFSIINSADNVTVIPISTPSNDTNGNTVVGHLGMFVSGGVAVPVDASHPLPVTMLLPVQTSQLAKATNVMAGVFDAAIAAPATGSIRKGGSLWNTSQQTLLVYFGPHSAATAAAGIPLNPGDSISCNLPSGVVLQDEVSVACTAAASQPYVVTYQ
ncbi:MAG: hypothetical protein RQ966_18270 [Acetobacteraceae bacterium]|nr:hypothetical protein [Acetobacteraceae bacterium]